MRNEALNILQALVNCEDATFEEQEGAVDIIEKNLIEVRNAAFREAVDNIEKDKARQSFLQGSEETGLGAISQRYFRKGVNWSMKSIFSLIDK